MTIMLNDHFCSCSVAALNNVSSQSPEETIKQYVEQLKERRFSSADKKYVDGYRYGYYIHVFFSGPDMRTLKKGMSHYSEVGSCDKLAAYIREQNLGPCLETEPRWNHRHSERSPGTGDVIAYIWSPDPDALEKWHQSRLKPVEAPKS